MNAQPIDRGEFEQQVKLVCALHQQAPALAQAQVHVVSTDEMTGIQALERAYPTRAMQMGQVERVEFEYIRHHSSHWDKLYAVGWQWQEGGSSE